MRIFFLSGLYQCWTGRWWGYHGRRWRFLTARWQNTPWHRRENWEYSQSEEPQMYSRFQEHQSNSWSSSSRFWSPFFSGFIDSAKNWERKRKIMRIYYLWVLFICWIRFHGWWYNREARTFWGMHVTCFERRWVITLSLCSLYTWRKQRKQNFGEWVLSFPLPKLFIISKKDKRLKLIDHCKGIKILFVISYSD